MVLLSWLSSFYRFWIYFPSKWRFSLSVSIFFRNSSPLFLSRLLTGESDYFFDDTLPPPPIFLSDLTALLWFYAISLSIQSRICKARSSTYLSIFLILSCYSSIASWFCSLSSYPNASSACSNIRLSAMFTYALRSLLIAASLSLSAFSLSISSSLALSRLSKSMILRSLSMISYCIATKCEGSSCFDVSSFSRPSFT